MKHHEAPTRRVKIVPMTEFLKLQADRDALTVPRQRACTCWHRQGQRKGWTSAWPCPLHPEDGP